MTKKSITTSKAMLTFYMSPMGTKALISTAGIFGLSILFMGCPKECTSPERAYQAVHQIMSHDSVSIGDTLWLISEMDCNDMYNYVTSQSENFCGSTFSFTLVLQNYQSSDTIFIHKGAVDLFKIVNSKGRIWNSKDIPSPHAVNQVEFETQGDKYLLEVGLIPQQQGYYTIGLGNGGSFGKQHCDRSSLRNTIKDNSSDVELLSQVLNNRDLTNEDISNIFCFEVY